MDPSLKNPKPGSATSSSSVSLSLAEFESAAREHAQRWSCLNIGTPQNMDGSLSVSLQTTPQKAHPQLLTTKGAQCIQQEPRKNLQIELAQRNVYEARRIGQLTRSNLHNTICAEQLAAKHFAQINLHRTPCAERLAQNTLL